ncbi:FxSxx-COOH cyclophane-containing RiPP peptide [Kitasatospora viridis]|uniref:FXSXX-COOH protein n=1 Tax=Kitasatospora viridis TaxID=281105 RepID=A0A561UGB9_9ACTN|nr:FxSxx-COOH cyclophane-containing RiPP peptide [Kitasatospora viridis]TWF98403.1 FXSXX-COOH protein [Kitasatospora viridis]
MTTVLTVEPAAASDREGGPQADTRIPLDQLAALGVAELTAALHRALPGGESGQVAVAAFNSSI